MTDQSNQEGDMGIPSSDTSPPSPYRASMFHEIPYGDGVKRVEAGFIVVTDDDGVHAYPPEVFAEENPDADISAIAEWPAISQE